MEIERPPGRRRRRERALLLFPGGSGGWSEGVRAWDRDPLTPEPGWAVYPDSRAFVWTCAVVGDGAAALTRLPGGASREGAPEHAPWEDRRWIELLEVDPPGYAGDRPSRFRKELARERTYRRWAEAGTLYGFTVHSGAMLGPPLKRPEIHRHFAETYFDQTLLLLYLRVTSLRFSEELTRLTGALRREGGGASAQGRWEEDFSALREDFAVFTNLYEFPRVSNQEQGIEMYTLARRVLDVEEFFDEVEDEIRSGHEYFDMRRTQEESRLILVLTLLATLGLPLAAVTSFFGMNILVEPLFEGDGVWHETSYVVLASIAGLALLWLAGRLAGRNPAKVTRLLLGRIGSRGHRRRRR